MIQDIYTFHTEKESKIFNKIIQETRCTVCDNQTLADSKALFAYDLKNAIYKKVKEGQSEEQIRTFIFERFGDYASYRPPIHSETLILWLCPFFMLLIAFVLLKKYYARK